MNNGRINLGEPGREPGEIALGPDAGYSGTGRITRLGYPYDLDDSAWTALAAACAASYSEPAEYEVEGEHCFTVPAEGLTIPDNLYVRADKCIFIVPDGAALTVSGEGEMEAAGLECTGTVTVDGFLYAFERLLIGEEPAHVRGFMMITLDAWLSLWESVDAAEPDTLAEKFSFESDNAVLDILVFMTEEEVTASMDYPMFHIPHIRETRVLSFPWTLDRDRRLDADLELLILNSGKADTVFTVPDGMTLELAEGSMLSVYGAAADRAAVQVQGLLINNGEVFLDGDDESDAGDVALIDRGIYAGRGTVTRFDEPYAILNDPTSADLRLPAELEVLDSEALASDRFESVCIPSGTTRIAPDAFGDRDRLIVFGTPRSAADTFAQEHNYLFAPVA